MVHFCAKSKKKVSFMSNNFENSLIELENILTQLENSDISLDESIKLFEKGVKLSEDCRKMLKTAENKITTLTEVESFDENDN